MEPDNIPKQTKNITVFFWMNNNENKTKQNKIKFVGISRNILFYITSKKEKGIT